MVEGKQAVVSFHGMRLDAVEGRRGNCLSYEVESGQVARVGEFIHIDYAAFRVLVHEQTHDVRAYEARTSRDDDAFSSGHFILVV